MTNPATPPAPSSGGMPKWLMILLVILLVILLGCCGAFSACLFFARKTAQTGAAVLQQAQEHAMDEASKARQQMQQELERRAQDEAQQAARQPGNPTTPDAPTEPRSNPQPTTPALGDALPAGFPSDVPIYSGFKTTYKLAMSDMGSVSLEGTESPAKVAAYYASEMEKKGWKQVLASADNDQIFQTYAKDNLSVSLQISGGDKTHLQITYNKK